MKRLVRDLDKNIDNKNAVSPMIATVLLIMIVIIIAIILLIWLGGFIQEAITKEIAGNEKEIEQACSDVDISAVLNNDGSFGFENIGNVPIYEFNVKLTSGGSSDVVEMTDSEGIVNPGIIKMVQGHYHYDYDEIKIIPVLLGKSESGGTQEFLCPERNALVVK